MHWFLKPRWALLCTLLTLVSLTALGALWYHARASQSEDITATATQYKTPEESDVYVRFEMEAYDRILDNYWAKVTDSDVSQLFDQAVAKALGTTTLPQLRAPDRAGTATMLAHAFAYATTTEEKKQLTLNTLIVALYNLPPTGRNQLMSTAQQKQLSEEVSNINPGNDLYKNLDVSAGATPTEVNAAFAAKQKALANATSSEDKAALAQAQYAHTVLANQNTKTLYDQAKIEPTVFGRTLGRTLYFNLTKISPTTLREFGLAVEDASTTPGLNSLVIDVRGNIGGALDFTGQFLGLFIGANQYAYDLFHKGDLNVQRTTLPKFPELDRYKEIAIITDGMSQSTAELLSTTFKKMHLAHVVGTKTRGWGSVETTYPMQTVIDPGQTFAILLVHSLTLLEDNTPIEGHGVTPDVDIGDPQWKSKLPNFFNSSSLISAIEKVVPGKPLQ